MAGEITFDRFHGLDLASDPIEVGGDTAIDLLNVEFTNLGRVGTRRGSSQFVSSVGKHWALLVPTPSYLVALSYSVPTTSFNYIDNLGNVTGLGTKASWAPNGYASIGTPVASYTFLAGVSGVGGGVLRRFNNITPGVVDSVGFPLYVAAWQNRLVQANYASAASTPTGANGSNSTVFFSDPGAPETYGATAFENLSPGDGEEIKGAVQWHDELYIVKQTAMYVFYSISPDADGLPEFNWRRVDLGFHAESAVAGKDGVYIAGEEGVFVTSGDRPVELTSNLRPLFDRTFAPTISYADNRLYIEGVPSYPWIVLDTDRNEWTIWDLGATATGPVAWDAFGITKTYYITSDEVISVLDPALTLDNGSAIAWYWQSGWFNGARPLHKKFTRWTRLWGSGTPTVAVYSDLVTADANAAAIPLGVAPAIAEGYHKVAYGGIYLAHKLSGSTPAAISQITHDVAGMRL